MNETCDRCGPAVRAAYHASRGGRLARRVWFLSCPGD